MDYHNIPWPPHMPEPMQVEFNHAPACASRWSLVQEVRILHISLKKIGRATTVSYRLRNRGLYFGNDEFDIIIAFIPHV